MVVVGLALALEPEVVVVEAPTLEAAETHPASVTSVPIDERLPEGADLGAVVGQVSGVSVQRLGGLGDFASLSIRGSTSRQVAVFLDGVPLNPDGVGAVDLSELPVQAFGRVDVWRGSAPVSLGGTAMGGAVDLVTADRSATAFVASAGSYATGRIRGLVARRGDNGDVLVAASALSKVGDFSFYDDGGTRFDDTDDEYERRANNDTRLATGLLRLRTDLGRWRLTVLDSVLTRSDGVPGFVGQPTRGVRYGVGRNLAVLQVDRRAEVPLRLRLHHRVRREVLEDPLGELGTGSSRTPYDAFGGEVHGGVVQPSFRADGRFTVRRDGFLDADRWVWQAHAGSTVYAARKNLQLVPGVSVVGIRSRGAGESASAVVLPRFGARVNGGDVSVRANIGRTFRPPDPTELFGNRGPLAGRPDLRPERGTSADLGLSVRTDDLRLEMGGFFNASEDLITYVQNAQQTAIPTNLGRARVMGVEGAFTWTRWSWLDWQTNVTVTEARNRTPGQLGNRLPRVPLVQVDQRAALVGGGVRLGWTFTSASGVFTDAANLNLRAPRHLHGAFLRGALGRGVSAELDVLNLTHVRDARVPANPLDPDGPRTRTAVSDFVGYPLPGRTVLFSVRFEEGS